MYDNFNSESSLTQDEKVEYSKQDKIPTNLGNIPKDSSSSLPEYVELDKNWLSEKNKSFDFNYDHSVGVFDVAAYIMKQVDEMTTMKLQKLVYYCQAWSLVWDEEPLFKENIEAWSNGPVVRELFNYHRGQFMISSILIGNPDILNERQLETINAVLDYYGNKSSQWLSDLTHMENPWRMARMGMNEKERGNRIIGLDYLAEYYGSLPPEE